jgi:hypothetical protein
MHVVMTGATEHQRFAPTGGHHLNPPRLWTPASLLEVAEVPNVVDFDLFL